MNLQQIIDDVLARHDYCCLDNNEERRQLAKALCAAIAKATDLNWNNKRLMDINDRKDRLIKSICESNPEAYHLARGIAGGGLDIILRNAEDSKDAELKRVDCKSVGDNNGFFEL